MSQNGVNNISLLGFSTHILLNFALSLFWVHGFCLGIDGLGDMRPICGIIVAERKGKQGKEGKVRKTFFSFSLLLIFWLSLTKARKK